MTKEEFIKNIVDNMTIRKDEGSDINYYDNNGHTVFEYDPEYDVLWVSWAHVWRILSNEYSMEYADIRRFIKRTVVEVLNLGDVTPRHNLLHQGNRLWKS